ncbi:GNAT family N-acetyltransferase [Nocardia sp. NBC_00565]|uniref:GNAT family N-acetyltransferase n=1 Tax=Nocardia sp. NBC_00565 TaxID=2975993 RepID=UPI002E7FE70D|nr:GNAT family N-acetyltransferase [Nocardia sp. NBC_00565]WUC07699.1 GNAT family N-acetyltransferase [Nocardia sp. NBC_00565]
MKLRTSEIRPQAWAEVNAATTDYAVSDRWLETMGPLLPGEPRWMISEVDGRPGVGLHTRFLKSPPAEPRYDIAAILRGEIPSLEPRSVPPSAPDTASLYPSVLAVLPGYTCVAAGPGATDPIVLGHTLRAVHDWAERQGARSISFLYVPERQHILRRALEEFGARPVPLYPTCVMPVDFADIEEYLAQLSRQRRQDLRRLLRRIDENGMRLGEEDLADVRDDVLELRLGSLRKYHATGNRAVQAATLDRVIGHYPPQDRMVTTVRHGERVVGFTLSLRHGDTVRTVWSGRSLDAYGAYFVMVFYGIVAAALRRGCTSIDFGTLKWREKVSFGCTLEQLTGHTWTL